MANLKSNILYTIKLDRNELCYCGSGKKYKHCCLNNPKPNAQDLIDYYNHWKSSREVNRVIETAILDFPSGLQEYFTDIYFDNPFIENENFDPDSPEWKNFHNTQIINTVKSYIYNALESKHDDVEGLTDYVIQKAEKMDLGKKQIEYLYSIANTPASFYKIESTDPAQISTIISDLFSDQKITVIDRSICRSGRSGYIIFGKAVPYKLDKNQYVLETPGISAIDDTHENWLHDCIIDASKQTKKGRKKTDSLDDLLYRLPILPVWIITAYIWYKTHPKIKNYDGDDVRFIEVVYNFTNRQEVLKELNQIKELNVDYGDDKGDIEITWMDIKKNVVLGSFTLGTSTLKGFVNSRKRLKKLENIFKKIKCLSLRDIQEKSLDDVRAKSSKSAKSESDELMGDPEVKKEIINLLMKHYESWPDEKIPALDDKKPRDLVKTPEGIKKVQTLIKKMERDYADLPESNAMHGFSLDFIRKKLNIE
ncbi:MAG: SEC-C domain-containing protein [Spirochaetia bacterium]|nr:SEC-C domain-containing protein [Spirochaetia bacterium]